MKVWKSLGVPWNKGWLVDQEAPLKLMEICAIRIRRQFAGKFRDTALFNLAMDSGKLAGLLAPCRGREISKPGPPAPAVPIRWKPLRTGCLS